MTPFSLRIQFEENECVKAAARDIIQAAVMRQSSRQSNADRLIASRMQRRDGTSGHAMIRLMELREQKCNLQEPK